MGSLSSLSYAKKVMLDVLPPECDVLCTHPMFGPESAPGSWQSKPFVYEQVRVRDYTRVADFLKMFEAERCNMIEMDAEQHDKYSSKSQFMTHLVGRVLKEQKLEATPIDTMAVDSLCKITELTTSDSFDLFYGLYKHTSGANDQIATLREAVSRVERQLAAKEAYLAARDEMKEQVGFSVCVCLKSASEWEQRGLNSYRISMAGRYITGASRGTCPCVTNRRPLTLTLTPRTGETPDGERAEG